MADPDIVGDSSPGDAARSGTGLEPSLWRVVCWDLRRQPSERSQPPLCWQAGDPRIGGRVVGAELSALFMKALATHWT